VQNNDCFVSNASDGATYLDPKTESPYMQEATQ